MKNLFLAGDIGGTKTILCLAEATQNSGATVPPLTYLYEQTYDSQSYGDLLSLVQTFSTAATTDLGPLPKIDHACFGIAGPVLDNTSVITNLSWPKLIGEELATALQIPVVTLINDFTAIGYGILGLTEKDYICLQEAPKNPQAPIAVLGAGTGLGQGFLIPTGTGRYRVFGSEGAHGDFAPRTEQEFQLLQYLKTLYQVDRISIERVVSGTGITAIYQFLRTQNPSQESEKLAAIYQEWEQESEKTSILATAISQAALNKEDPLSEETLRIFVEAYGAEAGNLALKLLPYGGLYLAGGVGPKILPLLQDGRFLESFLAKGRMRPLLLKMPVYLITDPKIGLKGAMLCAASGE